MTLVTCQRQTQRYSGKQSCLTKTDKTMAVFPCDRLLDPGPPPNTKKPSPAKYICGTDKCMYHLSSEMFTSGSAGNYNDNRSECKTSSPDSKCSVALKNVKVKYKKDFEQDAKNLIEKNEACKDIFGSTSTDGRV